MKNGTMYLTLAGVWIAAAMVLTGRTALAQTIQEGEVEIGQRALGGNRTSSKFEEYRTLPSGTFMNRFFLNVFNKERDCFVRIEALRAGQEDQNLSLVAGLGRKLQLKIGWDQTPHLLGLNGRSLFLQSQAGSFTLARQTRVDMNKLLTTDTNPSQSGVQPDLAAIAALVNGSARSVELVNRRKKASVELRYTPMRQQNREWKLDVQYSSEARSGSKPMGTTFQFSSINELPQPIDYQTQEFKIGTEYAAKRWNAGMQYSISDFKNHIDAMIWENPFQITDAVSRPTTGRLVLSPDNTAHTFGFYGAVNLPKSTRFSTTVSYGWRRQNDPFQDYTTNTALQVLSTYPTLPATSLKGAVNVLTTHVTATSRPFRPLSFNFRYRLYDYRNESRSLLFPKYIGYGDYQLSNDARQNLPIAHKRQNVEFDANWRLRAGDTVKVGYGYEQWNRKFRDAPKTDEQTLSTALNLVPSDLLTVRTAYSRAWRNTHDYDFHHHVGQETFPLGESGLGTLEAVLPELRRFDMAARIRDRASFTAQVSPLEAVTLTGTA
ncbi:MAG: MtrB/PioB family outer membrane beta-barrel protein [candidate division Zixibacteria bacterium]|nr:MtrB/PioB family outer membrane beta-barrel protein [candidate division Zixibacteria bacterium]